MAAPRVECPVCRTSYTAEHLGIPVTPGTLANVECVCGHFLAVAIRKEPRRILGIPFGRKVIRVDLVSA